MVPDPRAGCDIIRLEPMQMPGAPSLVLLAYLFVFLPWAAARSARRLRGGAGDGAIAGRVPPRERLWTGVVWSQVLLFVLAWVAGRSFGYEMFVLPSPGLREIDAAAAALVALFASRAVLRVWRTEAETRRAVVHFLAPRTPREHAVWVVAVLAASVAEEAAYRGVGFTVLWYAFGNPAAAALLSAFAFALAHAVQGWKSGVFVFAAALVAQALVLFTKSLVLAMAVHALYDLLAGFAIARQARRYDEEARAAGAGREEEAHDHRRPLDRLQPEP